MHAVENILDAIVCIDLVGIIRNEKILLKYFSENPTCS